MEVMTREAPTPEVSPPPARSRVCETETPEVEAVHPEHLLGHGSGTLLTPLDHVVQPSLRREPLQFHHPLRQLRLVGHQL